MQKIMFNDRYGLTAAVLEGRKTMTRRIISPAVWEAYYRLVSGKYLSVEKSFEYLARLSPIKVGEVVAIAQSYRTVMRTYPLTREELNENGVDNNKYLRGLDNKMFVKPTLMPHYIKITDLKVERLQHITDEDCLREGIIADKMTAFTTSGFKTSVDSFRCEGIDKDFSTARYAFAALIDKVGKKGTWASNPWVFCYSFELVD